MVICYCHQVLFAKCSFREFARISYMHYLFENGDRIAEPPQHLSTQRNYELTANGVLDILGMNRSR